MPEWFDKLTGRQRSASDAKERLKLVLIHDRTDISTATLDQLKDDLLLTISNHIPIDASRAKISLLHEGREQRLVADIPLKRFNK